MSKVSCGVCEDSCLEGSMYVCGKCASKALESQTAANNNERAESATKTCEGCRNWKRDKRWGLNCTTCIRNIDRIVDNFNVAQSPVS
jgi:hypothetical protein